MRFDAAHDRRRAVLVVRLAEPRPSELQRPQPRRPQLRWSPDSKKIAVYADRRAQRRADAVHLVHAAAPKVLHAAVRASGDTACRAADSTSSTSPRSRTSRSKFSPRPNQLTIGGSVARLGVERRLEPHKVYVIWITRGSKSAYLASVDADTGDVSRGRARLGQDVRRDQHRRGGPGAARYVTKDNAGCLLVVERDGWAHLYRFDAGGAGSGAGRCARDATGDGGMRRSPVPRRRGRRISSRRAVVCRRRFSTSTRRPSRSTSRRAAAGRAFLYYAQLYRVELRRHGPHAGDAGRRESRHRVLAEREVFRGHVFTHREAAGDGAARRAATGTSSASSRRRTSVALQAAGWKPRAGLLRQGARRRHRHLRRACISRRSSTRRRSIRSSTHIYPGPQVGSGRGLELQERRRAVLARGAGLRRDPARSPRHAAAIEGRSTTTTTETSATTVSPITSPRSSSSPRATSSSTSIASGSSAIRAAASRRPTRCCAIPSSSRSPSRAPATTTTAGTTSTGRRSIRG